MQKNLKYFVMGAALVAGGLVAAAVGDLAVFKAGEPIKSAEVNANFAKLKEAIEQPIRTQQLEDGAITLPKLSIEGDSADGKVLKLQGGSLAWADDLLGKDGAAYSAGSGLSLTGSTFSLADGGVTRSKLAASGGSDGQVLKLQGGNLVWANDIAGGGSGGASYSADGSSLQLSGSTFSVRDGGIGTVKLADGSVNAAKLANGSVSGAKLGLPFTLEAASVNPLLSLKNPSGTGLSVQSTGSGFGIQGQAVSSAGLYGISGSGMGVEGRSAENFGVRGIGNHGRGGGVLGQSSNGVGVFGSSESSTGVEGLSRTFDGIVGTSTSGRGVRGKSESSYGVHGDSGSSDGVRGYSAGLGAGVFGESIGGSGVIGIGHSGYAAEFSGGRFGRGICYFAGGSGWSCTSDVNAKENFKEVDVRKILEAVVRMPVTRWNMKGDARKTPHIGPTAQDFKAAFGLGESDKTISTSDAQGVALAAIQGLYQEVQLLRVQDRDLRQKLGEMEARLKRLEPSSVQGSRP